MWGSVGGNHFQLGLGNSVIRGQVLCVLSAPVVVLCPQAFFCFPSPIVLIPSLDLFGVLLPIVAGILSLHCSCFCVNRCGVQSFTHSLLFSFIGDVIGLVALHLYYMYLSMFCQVNYLDNLSVIMMCLYTYISMYIYSGFIHFFSSHLS